MAMATVMDMDMGMAMAMRQMIIRMTFWGLKNCGARLSGLLEEGNKYHFVKL